MPDPKRLDFDQPESKAQKRAREREDAGLPPAPPKVRDYIPRLPRHEVNVEELSKRPDTRAAACVNMRLAGAPFNEIAKELGYVNAASARTAYIQALANTNPPEDWETLRLTEQLRAEQQLARSVAMAGAEYLVITGENGEEIRVPNADRLKWHEQARHDLALHATITGAKAPARVEMSADTQELNKLVNVLLEHTGGHGDVEADIFQIQELGAAPAEED